MCSWTATQMLPMDFASSFMGLRLKLQPKREIGSEAKLHAFSKTEQASLHGSLTMSFYQPGSDSDLTFSGACLRSV